MELTTLDLINAPAIVVVAIVIYKISLKLIEAFSKYKDSNMNRLCDEIKSMTETQNQLIALLSKNLINTEKDNQAIKENINSIHSQIDAIVEKIAKIEERIK